MRPKRKMAWAADTGVSSSLRSSALSGLHGRHYSQEKTNYIVEAALSAAEVISNLRFFVLLSFSDRFRSFVFVFLGGE
jgi:hypothetical protein